jgi:allophanate hydrolase
MASQMLQLVVAGAHMSGLRLNHQLTDLGARMLRAAHTAPVYRERQRAAPTRRAAPLMRPPAWGAPARARTCAPARTPPPRPGNACPH